ncbi:MAG: hypothetical protein EOO77_42290 [Oxalobacteraceae bacterium]|nr:MAG: hypothetical protein EOO77_42290 [Oxalobacteraceae bacterium]
MAVKKINELTANTLTAAQLADAYVPVSGIGGSATELYKIKVSDFAPAIYRTLGTTITYNVGTSGATVPVLNAANSWALPQTFNTAANGSGAILIRAISPGAAVLDFMTADGLTTWGRLAVPGSGQITFNGYAVWHSNNDGIGSGLDADLLDGQEGAFYRDAGNLNTGTFSASRFPASGVTPGTFSNPVLTIDTAGRVLAASNGAPSGPSDADIAFRQGYI